MKKYLSNLLLAILSVASFTACDNAEESYVSEGRFPNVFDIKEGNNSYYLSFVPAFSDTVYSFKKTDVPDLSAGDRAYMLMKYTYDVYAMQKPQLSLHHIITKFPRRSLDKKGSFIASLYNTPFNKRFDFVDFYDMKGATHTADFLWADAETQNIVLSYNKGLNCSPKMVVDSLREGNSVPVLYFRLYADISNRGWVEDEKETYSYDNNPELLYKVFSYNMDWDLIKEELTASEQAILEKSDTLTSCISVVVNGCNVDDKGMYIPYRYFTEDKFANPLYNRK